MAKITVIVPDGDCVSSGKRCQLVKFIQTADSDVIKAYPVCQAYGVILEMYVTRNEYTVIKCERCTLEGSCGKENEF